MHRRLRPLLNQPASIALSVLAAVALATASTRTVPGGPGQQGSGSAAVGATARIGGQVVAADTGAPIKRTAVSILGGTPRPAAGAPGLSATIAAGSPPPGMIRRQVATDEAGRFECAELPAGRYTISVREVGPFLASAPQFVEVAAGGSASITFRLDRGGSITGRVLDDEGEPVVRAHVSAGQRRSIGGVWRLMQVGAGARATTDDLGHFRLYGLPTGEFYVSASYTVPTLGPDPAQAGEQPRYGFAPTFYPSAAGIEGARKVGVRLGQETGGIDLTLVRATLGSVSGRVTDAAGAPLTDRQVGVMLMARRDTMGGVVPGGQRWREDGTFAISNVPPGRYLVAANVLRQAPSSDPADAGFEQVTVDGDDVTIQVQTNSGATVAGRLVIEGAKPIQGPSAAGTTGPARASITARVVDADFYVPSSFRGPVTVGEDFTFVLRGLRGRVVPSAFVPGAVLKSVARGGTDITANGLWLKGTESVDDVTITVTTDIGAIEGRVMAADGGAADAWIVVSPEDSSRRFPGSPFVGVLRTRRTAAPERAMPSAPTPGQLPGRTGVSLQAGGFLTQPLLPGRYAVATVPVADTPSGEAGSLPPTDPESLARLRQSATIVSVAAGETATVHLQLKK